MLSAEIEGRMVNIPDYSGYWTGEIKGTNQGGFAFDLKQDGSKVTGIAMLSEPSLG